MGLTRSRRAGFNLIETLTLIALSAPLIAIAGALYVGIAENSDDPTLKVAVALALENEATRLDAKLEATHSIATWRAELEREFGDGSKRRVVNGGHTLELSGSLEYVDLELKPTTEEASLALIKLRCRAIDSDQGAWLEFIVAPGGE